MSKFQYLCLLPRDFSKLEITYQEAVFVNQAVQVQVKKVYFEKFPGGKQTTDERETKTYEPSEATGIEYLTTALRHKPSIFEDLHSLLISRPDILAAIQSQTTYDLAGGDEASTPPSQPTLGTQVSDDSVIMGTLGSQGTCESSASSAEMVG